MPAAAILYFFRSQICNGPNGQTVTRAELRHRAKFCWNCCRDMAIFQTGGRQVVFLKLQSSDCGTHHNCRIASPTHHAKFRGDWSNRCHDIWILDFSNFSWIFKILHFNDPNGREGRTASLCQISSKSLKSRLSRWDITIFRFFQDGGHPPSWICNACVGTTREGPFGGLYHCAKFGWNRCSSFDNMHVFRYCEFGLKTPQNCFFGVFWPPKWGEMWKISLKRHILERVRVVWDIMRDWKSVNGSDL